MQIEKYSKCKFFVDKSSSFKADVLNNEACEEKVHRFFQLDKSLAKKTPWTSRNPLSDITSSQCICNWIRNCLGKTGSHAYVHYQREFVNDICREENSIVNEA